ncbi:hypothetical protein Taro_004920 [Colocasia esculenta]|uniref:Kinetochore protein SPC25 n=1 Tax=Colocasia esculenta TaxID=4460 RepID=A0A843TT37_COLES|nr:hypothetical protein [Colocasia esculenta]
MSKALRPFPHLSLSSSFSLSLSISLWESGTMQKKMERQPIYRKIVDLRLVCEREIRAERQKASEAAGIFRRSLSSIRARAEENVADGEKLANVKAYLRKLEDDLRETLIVKNCNEAKRHAIVQSLSSAKVSTEELKKVVQEQRAKKDEYEAIVSSGLETLNQNNQGTVDREGTRDAILWYSKVLGFRTEGGEGVKFIFDKIDLESPNNEYSFTVRLDGDTYTLLQCEPYVKDVKELLKELNQTNGLFKFARTMRAKFQAAALNGMLPSSTSVYPELSTISISSPPPASSASGRDSLSGWNDPEVLPAEENPPKELDHGHYSSSRRGASQTSKQSALRRSPRFKGQAIA